MMHAAQRVRQGRGTDHRRVGQDSRLTDQPLRVLPGHAHRRRPQAGETEQRLALIAAWQEAGDLFDRAGARRAGADRGRHRGGHRGHVSDEVYDQAAEVFTERELGAGHRVGCDHQRVEPDQRRRAEPAAASLITGTRLTRHRGADRRRRRRRSKTAPTGHRPAGTEPTACDESRPGPAVSVLPAARSTRCRSATVGRRGGRASRWLRRNRTACRGATPHDCWPTCTASRCAGRSAGYRTAVRHGWLGRRARLWRRTPVRGGGGAARAAWRAGGADRSASGARRLSPRPARPSHADAPWLLIDIDDLGVGDPAWDLAPAGRVLGGRADTRCGLGRRSSTAIGTPAASRCPRAGRSVAGARAVRPRRRGRRRRQPPRRRLLVAACARMAR